MAKRAELIRFFTTRTSSAAEAEDIVQEIFLKIANLEVEGLKNEAAYLYRLGSNLMLDRVRARQRRSARENSYHQAFRGGANGEEIADGPEPDAALDAKRRLYRLVAAIEDLPPQCRRVFVMHKIEGRSHTEIAQELGVSRSAVEKHMITALKRLAAYSRDAGD
jgi:RNA polymerase sigma-70 factor (ECF subfamily)